MNTLVRDWAIVLGLVAAALAWRLFSRLSGRDRRRAEAARDLVQQRRAARDAPLQGSADADTTSGWSGPTTAPPTGEGTDAYVHEMTAHLWGVAPGQGADGQEILATRYANAFTGTTAGGRPWYAANAYTGVGVGGGRLPDDGQLTASVCTVGLGEVLPPLWVGPADRQPYVHLLLKEVTLESEDFDRRFRVQALDRKYASDVMSPRAMELVMQRDDWAFFLSFGTLVCVCRTPFAAVDDVRDRLGVLEQLVSFIPSFVSDDRGAQMPSLPDGTTLDPMDPASRAKLQQAFLAMTPAEREQAMTQMRAQGARFIAGMFGKDLSEADVEAAFQRADERRADGGRHRRDQPPA